MATPYMSLDLPVVSTTLGPEWATLLNAALTAVDNHDHTEGLGRKITSAALNINGDVAIGNNNLTGAKSYNMANQSSALGGATDVRSLYAVAGELYYNDSVGNQIQLTSGGALNASSIGAIGGDYGSSTANVYYNSTSKTFFFDQNTDQRAKLDIGDLIIRETVAAANGITIKSPSSLAASYSITLPAALPAANKMLQMSTTGVVTPEYITTSHVDPSGLGAAAYGAGSVGTAALADDGITDAKFSPAGSVRKITRQVFNSTPGDYPLVIPTGVVSVVFKGCGGGGGGGGNNQTTEGGGGGAGAQVISGLLHVTASVAQTFAPADVDISAETITINAHGIAETQSVAFSNSGGTLPTGLAVNTVYYAKDVTANTFKVSATAGGAAVNISAIGSGTHTVTTVHVVRLASGGSGALGTGTSGGESAILYGNVKYARFPGGLRGTGADALGGDPGDGGADFTWENQSTPGGNGGMGAVGTAGSTQIHGEGTPGTGGTTSGGVGGGGGGGGSVGNGGNGGNFNSDGSAGTFGGGGGGGGGGGSLTSRLGGAGGQGYVEVVYWEPINP